IAKANAARSAPKPRYDEAEQQYQLAAQIAPDDARAFAGTGECAGIVGSNLRCELILLLGFVVARLRSASSCIGFGDDGILFADWRFLTGLNAPATGRTAGDCRV